MWKMCKIAAALLLSTWAVEAEAASIARCTAKTRRCIVRLDKGIVGDTINVLNEKAQLVATGWIIKRKGGLGVISFKQVLQNVKEGYPVIVNVHRRSKEVKWASAFGPESEMKRR